jgi:hypothetical protein
MSKNENEKMEHIYIVGELGEEFLKSFLEKGAQIEDIASTAVMLYVFLSIKIGIPLESQIRHLEFAHKFISTKQ